MRRALASICAFASNVLLAVGFALALLSHFLESERSVTMSDQDRLQQSQDAEDREQRRIDRRNTWFVSVFVLVVIVTAVYFKWFYAPQLDVLPEPAVTTTSTGEQNMSEQAVAANPTPMCGGAFPVLGKYPQERQTIVGRQVRVVMVCAWPSEPGNIAVTILLVQPDGTTKNLQANRLADSPMAELSNPEQFVWWDTSFTPTQPGVYTVMVMFGKLTPLELVVYVEPQ